MLIQINKLPIYYINLDRDIARKQNIEKLFIECDMHNSHRIKGQIAKNKLSRTGCALSHKIVCEKIMNMPQNNTAIVLEDDLEKTDFYHHYIDVPENFDCIFLGISNYNMIVSPIENFDNLVKIHHMCSSHALLLRNNNFLKAMYQSIINSINKKTFHDEDLCKIFSKYNIYALKKPLFYQSSSANITNITI